MVNAHRPIWLHLCHWVDLSFREFLGFSTIWYDDGYYSLYIYVYTLLYDILVTILFNFTMFIGKSLSSTHHLVIEHLFVYIQLCPCLTSNVLHLTDYAYLCSNFWKIYWKIFVSTITKELIKAPMSWSLNTEKLAISCKYQCSSNTNSNHIFIYFDRVAKWSSVHFIGLCFQIIFTNWCF